MRRVGMWRFVYHGINYYLVSPSGATERVIGKPLLHNGRKPR